jgi:hypothetical protein
VAVAAAWAAWAATSTTKGFSGRKTSPVTFKHQLWGHLPPFFCANTPEYLCETLPDLCETKMRGVAATQISNCDGETLRETLFYRFAYMCQYRGWCALVEVLPIPAYI